MSYNTEYEKAIKYSEIYSTPSHEHYLHQIAIEPENKKHIKNYADFLESKDLHGISEVLNTAKLDAPNTYLSPNLDIPTFSILPKGRPAITSKDKIIQIPETPIHFHIKPIAKNKNIYKLHIITPSLKEIRKGDSELPIAIWTKLLKKLDVSDFISKFKSPEVRRSILEYTHNVI